MVSPRTRPQRPVMPMAAVLAHACPDLTDDFACRLALYAAGFKGEEIYVLLTRVQRCARRIRAQAADQLARTA